MKKQVVIVSCVFQPEPVVSAHTSVQIARELAESGHHVKVLAPFPNRPTGKIYPQYKRCLLKSETCPEGYKIIRCFSLFSPVSSLSSRLLENISFGLSVFLILLFSPRADIVYGNTWPIFAQGLLALVCRLRRMPLVLSIQDLYPESLVVQHRIGEGPAWYFGFLHWLDITIAKNCKSLIVISEQFKRTYVQDRGISEQKIHVVHNWIDHVPVDPQDRSVRKRHNIPEDAFLIVYGGNIGVAAGVDMVIQAFECLEDTKNIYLLIAGDGSMLDQCRALAKASGNPHIVFHTPWLSDETSSVLAAANLFILPTQGNQSLVSIPSKLINYLWAARPVLVSAHPESEIARIVTESSAGWVVHTSARAISRKIREVAAYSPESLQRYGTAGQTYALQHYSAPVNLSKIAGILLGNQA